MNHWSHFSRRHTSPLTSTTRIWRHCCARAWRSRRLTLRTVCAVVVSASTSPKTTSKYRWRHSPCSSAHMRVTSLPSHLLSSDGEGRAWSVSDLISLSSAPPSLVTSRSSAVRDVTNAVAHAWRITSYICTRGNYSVSSLWLRSNCSHQICCEAFDCKMISRNLKLAVIMYRILSCKRPCKSQCLCLLESVRYWSLHT